MRKGLRESGRKPAREQGAPGLCCPRGGEARPRREAAVRRRSAPDRKMTCEVRFACDAMLGRLARWLRAAGYDASWRADIDDWALIRQARAEGRVLLSSDSGIFRIGLIRDGELAAVHIPPGLRVAEQLAVVQQRLALPRRSPRCMACGGLLTAAPREQVRGQVPPRSYAWCSRFFRCQGCGRVLWAGSHWQHLDAVLCQLFGPLPEESCL
jgi:uncharacterized protein with PIN domain